MLDNSRALTLHTNGPILLTIEVILWVIYHHVLGHQAKSRLLRLEVARALIDAV